MPYLYSADPNLKPEDLRAALEPVLAAHAVGLVELLFRRERPGWLLRVMIENPTGQEPGLGITLDRCADVSRDLSVALDAADVIEPAYTLEVSSPGVERPLHDEADYQRFAGLLAKLVLHRPIATGAMKGQAVAQGVVRGASGGAATIEVKLKGGLHAETIPLSEIKHGHLVYDPTPRTPRGTGKGAKAGDRPRRAGHGKSSE